MKGAQGIPPGPGEAALVGVETVLRGYLAEAGWNVRSVPAPAGDLSGLGTGMPAGSVDLVAVDTVLTPLNHADKRAALATMGRWLRPHGQMMVREPVAANRTGAAYPAVIGRFLRGLWRVSAEASHGLATAEFYAAALRDVGFHDVRIIDRDGGAVLFSAQDRTR